MRRFAQRLRHRARRLPEETHVMIASAIAITVIFGLVIGASKIWPASPNVIPVVDGGRK